MRPPGLRSSFCGRNGESGGDRRVINGWGEIVGAGVTAFIGSVVGGLISRSGVLKRVDDLSDGRVARVESDVKLLKTGGCPNGKQLTSRVDDLKDRVHDSEQFVQSLVQKMIRVETALENQTSTFRDMSLEMRRFVEETAKQGERIGANNARLDGVHQSLRKHTDDRGIHHE